ncbi:hypothetical protein [Streptomyces erythrochromogenes]|uniref:hypothetical protein n=1 Tax=Streptomyces erythrochromogenes TaxID=285574 RepID=UPI0037D72B7E
MTTAAHPHGRHFKHCYVYEGSFCSCGGDYQGAEAGPKLDLPPRPFNLMAPTVAAASSE